MDIDSLMNNSNNNTLNTMAIDYVEIFCQNYMTFLHKFISTLSDSSHCKEYLNRHPKLRLFVIAEQIIVDSFLNGIRRRLVWR